jgi:hypothetical protein
VEYNKLESKFSPRQANAIQMQIPLKDKEYNLKDTAIFVKALHLLYDVKQDAGTLGEGFILFNLVPDFSVDSLDVQNKQVLGHHWFLLSSYTTSGSWRLWSTI